MLIDGEKWACEACVRGHRVSNCQHQDRPLQHINKKGRPVSQCQHCRSMRKSRASHVKCDCGEKTHKCAHLKTTVDGHKDSCCCNHGGRCTCTHKKEHPQLDTVPESESEGESATSQSNKNPKTGQRARRRADTTHSEGMLSFDEHGHHKPTSKHNKAAHKSGPYQLGRMNPLQSTSSLRNRSVDDLLQGTGMAGGDSRSSNSPASSGNGVQDRRKTRSEAASPLMTGLSTFSQLNGQLPPLDLSAIEYPPYVPNSADFFGNISDHEQPMFSAGLSATSVDWSHYDGLDFGSKTNDFAPSSYSQPQSFGGFDFSGSEQIPTLTTNTSTSGEVSEVEDVLANNLEEFETPGGFRNSTASSGFDLTSNQANILGSTDLTGVDFDEFKFMKTSTGVSKFFRTSTSLAAEDPTLVSSNISGLSGFSAVEDDPAFWVENYGHTLPNLADPDPSMPSFWDTQ